MTTSTDGGHVFGANRIGSPTRQAISVWPWTRRSSARSGYRGSNPHFAANRSACVFTTASRNGETFTTRFAWARTACHDRGVQQDE